MLLKIKNFLTTFNKLHSNINKKIDLKINGFFNKKPNNQRPIITPREPLNQNINHHLYLSGTTTTIPTAYTYTNSTLIDYNPKQLDKNLLKRFLKRKYSWILDVEKVVYNTNLRLEVHIEIHIMVSQQHYCELLSDDISKSVMKRVKKEIDQLLSHLYGENKKNIIIFFPTQSNTLLEYFRTENEEK
jgi:hypothetical protein